MPRRDILAQVICSAVMLRFCEQRSPSSDKWFPTNSDLRPPEGGQTPLLVPQEESLEEGLAAAVVWRGLYVTHHDLPHWLV